MLRLSRRIGESIIIAGNIKVTIMDVRGSQIRLGIEAPREVTIDREEIAIRKRNEANNKT